MSIDKSEARPLPGLPKAIFYLQLVSTLMDEIHKLLELVHREPTVAGENRESQSKPD